MMVVVVSEALMVVKVIEIKVILGIQIVNHQGKIFSIKL